MGSTLSSPEDAKGYCNLSLSHGIPLLTPSLLNMPTDPFSPLEGIRECKGDFDEDKAREEHFGKLHHAHLRHAEVCLAFHHFHHPHRVGHGVDGTGHLRAVCV